MSFLLLHQTLVVPRNFHCQVLFCLDQKLHPRFTLLQEGLLLQQEGLEFAAGNQNSQWANEICANCSDNKKKHLWSFWYYLWLFIINSFSGERFWRISFSIFRNGYPALLIPTGFFLLPCTIYFISHTWISLWSELRLLTSSCWGSACAWSLNRWEGAGNRVH